MFCKYNEVVTIAVFPVWKGHFIPSINIRTLQTSGGKKQEIFLLTRVVYSENLRDLFFSQNFEYKNKIDRDEALHGLECKTCNHVNFHFFKMTFSSFFLSDLNWPWAHWLLFFLYPSAYSTTTPVLIKPLGQHRTVLGTKFYWPQKQSFV